MVDELSKAKDGITYVGDFFEKVKKTQLTIFFCCNHTTTKKKLFCFWRQRFLVLNASKFKTVFFCFVFFADGSTENKNKKKS